MMLSSETMQAPCLSKGREGGREEGREGGREEGGERTNGEGLGGKQTLN